MLTSFKEWRSEDITNRITDAMLISKEIFKALTSLRQGKSLGTSKAPHKPILLLAVLRAIELGEIRDNQIFITADLVGLFRGYWNKIVTSTHSPNFALPFYHLKNESSGIWKLNVKVGFERALTSSNSIKSLMLLEELCNYASLREDIYHSAHDPILRDEMRTLILEKYFHKNLVTISGAKSYASTIEEMVMNESAANYKKQLEKVAEHADKVEIEEEQFIRGATFKKVVPRLYENACAITGLRIVAKANISMVDACHIIPIAESGIDHITNGIALTPTMHRAFDRGLIGVDENYRVLISSDFVENYSAHSLHQYEGKEINLPSNAKYYPSLESLNWHRIRFGL
ncbi:MAG: HNH endonuclease [Flavobacteriales bacterium]|nr:HNH endonuclease [Flavobacteriales bacterium]